MNTNTTFVLLLLAGAVQAGPRSSASYSLTTDTTDVGGQRTASAIYTNDASLGGIAGISTVALPSETAKQGYLAQLTDVTALQLSATSATVGEGATRQLTATQLLDDNTTVLLAPNVPTWSILSGPLSSISPTGLATAANVYQNTPALAQAAYAGYSGSFSLTILDSLPDNFGAYASDGLADSWQVQYFGLDNPDAAPAQDPDHDGQPNVMEFTFGTAPTDTGSIFHMSLLGTADGPQKITFAPWFADRTYVLKSSPDLTSWITVPGSIITHPANIGTAVDPNIQSQRNFYRIDVIKP